jgi:hypothetical protein
MERGTWTGFSYKSSCAFFKEDPDQKLISINSRNFILILCLDYICKRVEDWKLILKISQMPHGEIPDSF